MKLIRTLFVIFNITIFYSASQRCNNPLNSNLNKHQTQSYISSPQISSSNFCTGQNNKYSCCDSQMYTEQENSFDKFKLDFNLQNVVQVAIFDQNIRDILKNQDVALDSVDQYNAALENIDQAQEVMEIMRDNLPTIDTEQNTFNITDNGKVFNLTVGDDVYNFTGNDIDDYFNNNADMLREVMELMDDTMTSMIDLEIFKEANFITREKKGDHYSIRIDKDKLKQEFQLAQERIRRHIPAREKCFTKLTEYFAVNRCLQCEAQWQEIGIGLDLSSSSDVLLHLNTESCHQIVDECYDFIETSVEMNQNAILFVFVMSSKNLVESGVLPETGNFNSIETTEQELSFLSAMNIEFSQQVPLTTFFINPVECENQDNCNHICKTYLESTGIDLDVIFEDNVEENVDDILLQAVDFYNEGTDSDDEEPEQTTNTPVTMDSDNIFYKDTYQLNPFQYSKDVNANFVIQGASGVPIFNITGNQTYEDLFLEPTVINNELNTNYGQHIMVFQYIIIVILLIVL